MAAHRTVPGPRKDARTRVSREARPSPAEPSGRRTTDPAATTVTTDTPDPTAGPDTAGPDGAEPDRSARTSPDGSRTSTPPTRAAGSGSLRPRI